MIKVLIVDDSAFMRVAVRQILASDAGIAVAGDAVDGLDALDKVKRLNPDIVLLDVEMPVMDGLEALSRIMAETPTPVVMLSGLGRGDACVAVKCLEHGAIDFIPKPSGTMSYDIDVLREEIIEKVKVAAGVDVRKISLELPTESYRLERLSAGARKAAVVIGASTGGPRAIETVLSRLQRGFPAAVVVIQHMSAAFIPFFAERLRWTCPLDVSVAEDGATVSPGRVLVAAGDTDTAIEKGLNGNGMIIARPVRGPHSPIDRAMESAARSYNEGVLGVLLTGAGNDGAKGMMAIKKAGGATIAEDASTCIVYGMPKAAIEMGAVETVVPLQEIAGAITRMV